MLTEENNPFASPTTLQLTTLFQNFIQCAHTQTWRGNSYVLTTVLNIGGKNRRLPQTPQATDFQSSHQALSSVNGTVVVLKIDKWGLKDAESYIDPFVRTMVVDAKQNIMVCQKRPQRWFLVHIRTADWICFDANESC